MEESSGGTKYYIPQIDVDLKPRIGERFISIEAAEKIYRKYAKLSGFDVRLSNKKINSQGIVTNRYFVCSKEGNPTNKVYDSMTASSSDRKHRNSNYKRSGCQAGLKIHFVKEKNCYETYSFIERHNHMLLNINEMTFSRSRRQLNYFDQRNVFHGTSCNIGVAKSHRLRTASKGVGTSSGATIKDCQNYKRDMVTFVGNKDAQMLINTFARRHKCCPQFFFEYKFDKKELVSVFWADEIARLNYKEFGDVISFDATYSTNKHAMIFVPFVAVDNHKRSVVVGAALLNNETVPSFTWVLNAFVKAHGRQPTFVITDQCAAMKQAIPIAFPEAKHRLCMWHITKKIDKKVQQLLQESFKGKELCKRIHADEAVAYGAAVLAAKLSGERSREVDGLKLLDVNPLSLGVRVVGGIMSVLIPRNTTILVKMEKLYVTIEDNQSRITFDVYQGERSTARYNNLLGQFNVPVPLAPRGKAEVKVVFEIDSSGILSCSGKELTTGVKKKIVISDAKGRLSEDEIKKMVKDAEKYRREDREYKKKVCARNDLEKYIYDMNAKIKTRRNSRRIPRDEMKKMENAIKDANELIEIKKLVDVDEYNETLKQLEKLSVSIIP